MFVIKTKGKVYNHTPFGFNRNGDFLIANSSETRAINEIVKLHKNGFSLREIAQELELQGIKPKKSNCWHAKVIAGILKRVA